MLSLIELTLSLRRRRGGSSGLRHRRAARRSRLDDAALSLPKVALATLADADNVTEKRYRLALPARRSYGSAIR